MDSSELKTNHQLQNPWWRGQNCRIAGYSVGRADCTETVLIDQDTRRVVRSVGHRHVVRVAAGEVQSGVEHCKVRVVEHVERIYTELQTQAFFHRKLFLQGHIEVDQPRRVEPVHTRFQTQTARSWCEEAGRIKSVKRIARSGIWITILDYTHPRPL